MKLHRFCACKIPQRIAAYLEKQPANTGRARALTNSGWHPLNPAKPRRFSMRALRNALPSPTDHLAAFRFANRRKRSNNAEKSSHPKRNLYWSQKPHAL